VDGISGDGGSDGTDGGTDGADGTDGGTDGGSDGADGGTDGTSDGADGGTDGTEPATNPFEGEHSGGFTLIMVTDRGDWPICDTTMDLVVDAEGAFSNEVTCGGDWGAPEIVVLLEGGVEMDGPIEGEVTFSLDPRMDPIVGGFEGEAGSTGITLEGAFVVDIGWGDTEIQLEANLD
jgi:hypothetical protein